MIASKTMKIQGKIKNYEEQIEKMKTTKQQYQTLFKEIFQKHLNEENKEGAVTGGENPETKTS